MTAAFSENVVLYKFRGKEFTSGDIIVIQNYVSIYYDRGRTYISKEICKHLDWVQPNGWLKDRACRDVLIQLEKLNLITLPPSKLHRSSTNTRISVRTPIIKKQKKYLIDYQPLTSLPSEVTLVFSKGNIEEEIWNELVKKYHYLGHKVIVGRCIKYMIVTDNKILGAIAFSSPAWRLASRDSLLFSLGFNINEIRDRVLNNSRFLLLPNASVKNLASMVLSKATKKIVNDWNEFYSIEPLVVETFVQPSRFLGTCYQASNWLEIGTTQGFAKNGASYHNSQEPKKVYLFGLTKHLRLNLKKALLDKGQK